MIVIRFVLASLLAVPLLPIHGAAVPTEPGVKELHQTTPDETIADGRLGGTVRSFERAWGNPLSDAAATIYPIGVSYVPDGFGLVQAFALDGRVIRIAAYSPRPLDKNGADPDPADWSPDDAVDVAAGFLPRDAEIGDEIGRTRYGDPIIPGRSETLGLLLSSEVYERFGNGDRPGTCHIVLLLNRDGGVYGVEIVLGVGWEEVADT